MEHTSLSLQQSLWFMSLNCMAFLMNLKPSSTLKWEISRIFALLTCSEFKIEIVAEGDGKKCSQQFKVISNKAESHHHWMFFSLSSSAGISIWNSEQVSNAKIERNLSSKVDNGFKFIKTSNSLEAYKIKLLFAYCAWSTFV